MEKPEGIERLHTAAERWGYLLWWATAGTLVAFIDGGIRASEECREARPATTTPRKSAAVDFCPWCEVPINECICPGGR